MDQELDAINAIANHPAMEAIRLVKASERNDAEGMMCICQESPDMYAVASWLCGMVSGALDAKDYAMDQYLDAVAERAIEFIRVRI